MVRVSPASENTGLRNSNTAKYGIAIRPILP